MKLEELQQHWDAFGKTDPLWAILTRSDMRGGHWDADAFFETGRREISDVMGRIDAQGWLPQRDRALDFGCGVGRLTQALCNHFAQVDGVDIAASMIEGARGMNRFGKRCSYHVNERDDLALFGNEAFDFVYSRIVLQHMQPAYAERYVHEFLRLLKPGGLVWFQLPSHQAPLPETAPLRDDAFQARLSASCNEITLRVGETVPLTITVGNYSPVAWPGFDETRGRRDIALGNHWWKPDGTVHLFDDQRMRLPARLEPGATTNLVLMITAPAQPGTYHLELDMVQESVAWFGNKGSTPVRLPVTVTEPLEEPVAMEEQSAPVVKPTATSLSPRMEMYGTKPQQVLAWIDAAGGRILEVGEDPVAGDRWYSYRYIATR